MGRDLCRIKLIFSCTFFLAFSNEYPAHFPINCRIRCLCNVWIYCICGIPRILYLMLEWQSALTMYICNKIYTIFPHLEIQFLFQFAHITISPLNQNLPPLRVAIATILVINQLDRYTPPTVLHMHLMTFSQVYTWFVADLISIFFHVYISTVDGRLYQFFS